MTTYTTNKLYPIQPIGGNQNVWGRVLNNDLIQVLDSNLGGFYEPNVGNASGGDFEVSNDNAQAYRHSISGTLTGNVNYVLPNRGGFYSVSNLTTGNYAVTVKTASGDGATIPQNGQPLIVFVNTHTDEVDVVGPVVIPVNARNPKYGLSGLGQEGDGAKLIAAFDDAVASSRVLYVPQGRYLLDSGVVVTNPDGDSFSAGLALGGATDDTAGVTIIGDGIDRTIFLYPESDPVLSRNGAMLFLNVSNGKLQDFTIDCTGALDGNGISIRTDQTDGIADTWEVTNVKIIQSFNSAFAVTNGSSNGLVTNLIVDGTVLESHDVEAHGILQSSHSEDGIILRRPFNWNFVNCRVINPAGGGTVIQGAEAYRYDNFTVEYIPQYDGDRSSSGYPALRSGNGSLNGRVDDFYSSGMARGLRVADTDGFIGTSITTDSPEFEAILCLKQNGEANKTTPNARHSYSGVDVYNAHNSTLVESFAWLRADTALTSIYANFMTMNEAGAFVACNPGNPPSGNPMLLGQYLEGGGYPRNGGQRVGVVSYTAPYSLQVVDSATDITAGFSVPTSVSSGVPFTSGFVDVSADSCGASVIFTVQGSDPEIGVSETVGTITVERYTGAGGAGSKLADLTISITNTKTNINTGAGVTVSAVGRSVGVQDGTAFQSLRLIVNNTTSGGQAQNFDASILVYTLGATVNSSIDRDQVKVLTAIGLNTGDAIYFQSGDSVGCANVTNLCDNGRVTNVVHGETLNQDAPLRNFFCDVTSIVSYGHSGKLLRTLDGYMANTAVKIIQGATGTSILKFFDDTPIGYPYIQGVKPDTFETERAVVISSGSASNNTGITFTVVGTSGTGAAASWTGAGANSSSSVTTSTLFSTITSITPSGAVTGTVFAGFAAVTNALALSQSPGSSALTLNGGQPYVVSSVGYIGWRVTAGGTNYAEDDIINMSDQSQLQVTNETAGVVQQDGVAPYQGKTPTFNAPTSTTGVASSASVASGVALTLSGGAWWNSAGSYADLCFGLPSTVTLGQPLVLTNASASDMSATTFAIVGKDWSAAGTNITENLAGPGAGVGTAVTSVKAYSRIISITPNATPAGTPLLSVGASGVVTEIGQMLDLTDHPDDPEGSGLVVRLHRTMQTENVGLFGRNGLPALIGTSVSGTIYPHLMVGSTATAIVAPVQIIGAAEAGTALIQPDNTGTNISLSIRARGTGGVQLRDGANTAMLTTSTSGVTLNNGLVATGRKNYSTVPIGNVAYNAFGTNTTMVSGTLYCAQLVVERNMTGTGIAILNGATVGTNNGIVALYNSGGTFLRSSALAGALTSGANAFQAYNFTSTVSLAGPGLYCLVYQTNGNTDTIRTVAANTFINLNAFSVAGVFGTIPSTLSLAGSFSADVGPIGYVF